MHNLVIGGLGDQTYYFAWAALSKPFFTFKDSIFTQSGQYNYMFDTLLNPFLSNQPFSYVILSMGLSIFGNIFFTFWAFLNVILTAVFSYFAFGKNKNSVLFALLFTFSPFFYIHFGKHIELMYMWIVPLAIIYAKRLALDFSESVSDWLKLGLVLSVSIGFSNYLGFVTSVGVFIWVFLSYLLNGYWKKLLKFGTVLLLTTFLFSGLIIFRPLFLNYIKHDTDSHYVLSRPFEDFFTFSNRPWYFLIPSTLSPVYGNFASDIYYKLSKGGYFLADDYFAYEHSSAFWGYSFLITLVINTIYSFKDKNAKKTNLAFLITFIFLLTLSLPPYFTVDGAKFYTPGFLIYKLFPMFRVTARINIFLHFIALLYLSTVISKIPAKIKYVLIALLIISLVETYIPIKLEVIKNDPAYSQMPKNAKVIVYPYSKVNLGFYLLSQNAQYLVNPRDYSNQSFNSEIFTKSLDTNVQNLRSTGAEFIVSYEYNEAMEKSNSLQKTYYKNGITIYKIL